MMKIHKSQQFCCESQGLGPLVPGFDPEPVENVGGDFI